MCGIWLYLGLNSSHEEKEILEQSRKLLPRGPDRNIIKKILREQLEGTGDNPLSEKEIKLFKYINKKKPSLKKQSEFLDLFEKKNRNSFSSRNFVQDH